MSVPLNLIIEGVTEQQRWDPERKMVSSYLQRVQWIRRKSLRVTMSLKKRGRTLARTCWRLMERRGLSLKQAEKLTILAIEAGQ